MANRQADKIEKLEKDNGWNEEEFDFIQQFMRTILLKRGCSHLNPVSYLTQTDGASLIYTAPYLANSLQSLIHSSLGIHSLLKRQSLRHNVIDRDKIVVPANWDSWGKIRIIRDRFEMEGISNAWSIEIQDSPTTHPSQEQAGDDDDGSSAVTIFEQTIKDPKQRDPKFNPKPTDNGAPGIEVETTDMQAFLNSQTETLESLKASDEKDRATKETTSTDMANAPLDDSGWVNEHIGPVQFNMGGIQVDADDMVRKLKVRLSLLRPCSRACCE